MNDAAIAKAKIDTAPAIVLTPVQGLLVLLAVVVVIGSFLALNHALGVADVWAAFLFLVYWAGVERSQFAKLPACIIGAIVGLLLGYLLQTLPGMLGAAKGALAFTGVVLVMVYVHLMHWMPIALNTMTMIFLTVVTIPLLQANVNFGSVAISLAIGVIYFAGVVAIIQFFRQRLAKR